MPVPGPESVQNGEHDHRDASLPNGPAEPEENVVLEPQFYASLSSTIEHFFGRFIHTFRISPGESVSQAITRHEHYLAVWLGVQKHQKVLDVGCGNGCPTLEIAKFLDVDIVGVDLGDQNIRQAKKYTAQAKMNDKVTFITSDFMELDFKEKSFDAAYSLEATCYAPDLQAVYTEIFRVLKPGAKFVLFESVLGSGYHDDDPEHRRLLKTFEQLFGHTGIKKDSIAIEAMKQAGFEVEVAEDLAERPDEIPWYYPFDGTFGTMASLSDTFYKNYFSFVTRSFRSHGILYHVIGAVEKLKLFPSGTQRNAVQVMEALDALREVGQKKIITTMFLMVGKKPAL